MQIYYSNLCKMGDGLSESLSQMVNYGGDSIELMLDGGAWDEFEAHSRELAKILSDRPVTYSVHTPVWDMNLTSENAQAREAAMEAYRNSITFAALIGAEHVVLHPGFCYTPAFDKATAQRRAGAAIEKLCEFNGQYKISLLVENVGNSATSIFTQEEYIAFIQMFDGAIGSIFDIGHANLCGWDLSRTILRLNPYLRAVHLHDNDGRVDAHLPIGEGGIHWQSVFEALRECSPDLRLILEYGIGTPLEKLQKGKEILLRAFGKPV